MSAPRAPQPHEVWQAELRRSGHVEFRFRVRPVLGLLVAAPLVLAVGVALLFTGVIGGVVVGAVVVALQLLLLAVITRRLLTGRPRLRVDHEGAAVDDRRVEWHEVTGVVVYTARRTTYTVLAITPAASSRIRSGLGPLQRVSEPERNPAAGGPALVLPPWHGYRAADMAGWLQGVLSDARRRSSRGGPPTPTTPA